MTQRSLTDVIRQWMKLSYANKILICYELELPLPIHLLPLPTMSSDVEWHNAVMRQVKYRALIEILDARCNQLS
jgi:hypothetical protein